LAVLEGLDPDRKRILLQFLYESKLIKVDKLIISLLFPNLSGANLSEAKLFSSDLTGANLSGSNLSKANLNEADLRGANLRKANLSKAHLLRAVLRGTDLSEATHLTQEQIDQAHGDETTKLPDHLQLPAHWSKDDEEESKEDEGGEKR